VFVTSVYPSADLQPRATLNDFDFPRDQRADDSDRCREKKLFGREKAIAGAAKAV